MKKSVIFLSALTLAGLGILSLWNLNTYQISDISIETIPDSKIETISNVALSTRYHGRGFSIGNGNQAPPLVISDVSIQTVDGSQKKEPLKEDIYLAEYVSRNQEHRIQVGDNVIVTPEHKAMTYTVTKRNRITKNETHFKKIRTIEFDNNLKNGDYIKRTDNPFGLKRKNRDYYDGNKPMKITNKKTTSDDEYDVFTTQKYQVRYAKHTSSRTRYHKFRIDNKSEIVNVEYTDSYDLK